MTQYDPCQYLWVQQAARELGIAPGTLDYYMKKLGIESVKFPLSRRKYLLHSDFAKIREAKAQAEAMRGEDQHA